MWAQRPLDSLAAAPGLLPLLAAASQHRLMSLILPAVSPPQHPPGNTQPSSLPLISVG